MTVGFFNSDFEFSLKFDLFILEESQIQRKTIFQKGDDLFIHFSPKHNSMSVRVMTEMGEQIVTS